MRKPKKKNRYEQTEPAKPPNDALQTNLVAALAPLYTVAGAQVRMNLALPSTASNVTQQVVTLFAATAGQTSNGATSRNAMDDAEEALDDAFEELDQTDPFGSILGGKGGFGESADFPNVCFERWSEQVANIIEAHQNIERRLIAEGDPDAHQHANDAIRNSSRAASEALARCLHQPIRKLPVE